jgi:hypothetical protein
MYRVVNLLWQWWLERNVVWKGERMKEASGIAFTVTKHSDEFVAVGAGEHKQPPARHWKWSKPDREVVKINTDGSFNPTSGTVDGFAV